MCCQLKFSFPNPISLVGLRGGGQPPRHTCFSYLCKTDAFPYILHFTQNGLFPPKILCTFPIPSCIASSVSFSSLLLVSLFHLYFTPPFSLSLPSFPPSTVQYFGFRVYESPFFPATLLQTAKTLSTPLEKLLFNLSSLLCEKQLQGLF